MSLASTFATADNVIAALGTVAATTADPLLVGQYSGFAAVSAVTVYELALKAVLQDFAQKKHKVFGHFVAISFDRINGRISMQSIKDDYLPRFGERYRTRFLKLIDSTDKQELKAGRGSPRSSYGNVITWRNEFAHQGRAPTNATFPEVQAAYEAGKLVLHCLAAALVR